MNWKLDHHLKCIRKEVPELEKFRVTDHRTLGVFAQRMLALTKQVETIASLLEKGKASSEQKQGFLELAPRIAALSEKTLTASAEVAQAFFAGAVAPTQSEGASR